MIKSRTNAFSTLSINSIRNSDVLSALAVADYGESLRTERALDRAQAAFPMVELQGEQSKHSCCASNGDRRKRGKKIQWIRKNPLPISPSRHREAKFSTIQCLKSGRAERLQSTETIKEGEKLFCSCTTNISKPTSSLHKRFIPLFQYCTLSNPFSYFSPLLKLDGSLHILETDSPSFTLSLLIIHHPAVVRMKSPSSFQINISAPSHLRETKLFQQ